MTIGIHFVSIYVRYTYHYVFICVDLIVNAEKCHRGLRCRGVVYVVNFIDHHLILLCMWLILCMYV